MPATQKVLVFGATGVIGKVLVEALIKAKHNFAKIGIFTSAETAREKNELIVSFRVRGVDVLVGDLHNDDDVLRAYKGYDTIVSAMGRAGIDKQIDLVRLAEKSENIMRFIPSEYGTDVAYDTTSASEMPHQKKLKVRAYLEQSGEVTRLEYTYLVTGPFANLYSGYMDKEQALGSFDVRTKKATLLGDGNGRLALTTMADVGRSLVALLKNPEKCRNKAVRINSFTTTPLEILHEYERQTESKWETSYTSLETLKRLEARAWDEGKPLAPIYSLRRIWTEGKTLYEKSDNEAIGLTKMDTLEMVVQEGVWRPIAAFQSGNL